MSINALYKKSLKTSALEGAGVSAVILVKYFIKSGFIFLKSYLPCPNLPIITPWVFKLKILNSAETTLVPLLSGRINPKTPGAQILLA